MSNLCKTTLCSTVQSNASRVTSACDTTDILFSTVSVDKIEPTNRISKITVNDLPDANTFPNGHVAYLDGARVPVIASNGTWIGFDGRTLGTCIENQLWAWGINGVGQLGDGTGTNRCSPVREISSSTDWCQVSSACARTVGIKTTGQLWAWGDNTCGSLGDGTATNRFPPVREFCSATDWCGVSTGCDHTAAVKTSGQLWVWGVNGSGRLGDGTATSRCSPVREFCSATDWCQVGAGQSNTSAIKTTGQLWSWGAASFGRLGTGSGSNTCSPVREFCSATDWCGVRLSLYHTVAIKTTGQIWSWGRNSCGRLGDGTTTDRCSPVREFCSATNWNFVSAGRYGSIATKTSGELWMWGRNSCGQLGDGTITDRCSPVREICSATDWCGGGLGAYHATGIKTSGQIWSWGAGSEGRLGTGTTINSCSPVREFCSATDWCTVSLTHNHTTAIRLFTCACR